MKESAQAALAYLRSLAFAQPGLLPFDADLILDSHIHLHLPAGGTPKDGPSAGLAIVCAIASLLSGRPLPARLALTGEISLRGQVLPVGGIKEKFLAAHRYGKTRVIFPAANSHDLASLPASVRRQLDLVPVQSMTEALAAAGLTGSAGARVRAVQGRVQRPKLMRLVP
jgi:ATP-dependent Lon protease